MKLIFKNRRKTLNEGEVIDFPGTEETPRQLPTFTVGDVVRHKQSSEKPPESSSEREEEDEDYPGNMDDARFANSVESYIMKRIKDAYIRKNELSGWHAKHASASPTDEEWEKIERITDELMSFLRGIGLEHEASKRTK